MGDLRDAALEQAALAARRAKDRGLSRAERDEAGERAAELVAAANQMPPAA